MNNAMSNACFKPVVFGSPEYFALKQTNRSGRDVSYQTFSSKELAAYLGMNKSKR